MDSNNDDGQGYGPGAMEPGKLPDAAYLKRLWKTGILDRRITDRETWTNLAFIAGEHYAVWDANTRRFFQPDPRQDRSLRLKVNFIKDMWRSEVSSMVGGKPIPEVLPVTSEDSDRQAAMVGNRILQHEFLRLGFDYKRLESAMWTTAAGLSYMHPWWNPDAGKDGEIQLDVVPHFEIVPDPVCRFGLHEGQYVIHGRVLTEEEAYERFGHSYKATSDDTPYSWAQLFTGGANFTNPNRKGVLVLRMWHKPSRKFPDGFVITAVNEKIVEEITPYPYAHGELPFIDFHHVRIPGRFEGQSMLVDLIPLQRDYNQSRSRMAEIRKLLVGARWIAPTGSMHADRMTGLPNEVVEYDVTGPYKPEPLVIPNIPQGIFTTAEMTHREMQDIGGLHDVSKGSASSGTSGAGIALLQEKDQSKLATTLMQQELSIARVGEQTLGLVKQYWTDVRAVRVWHEEMDETGVHFFKGEDAKGDYEVRVVPGSSIPRSKHQTTENLLRLWDHKVIQDPVMMIKEMELPSSDMLVNKLSVDKRQAKREHDRLFKAEPTDEVIVEGFHNHMEHIQVHNDFRKTETFEKWPPALKAQLADHVVQHYEFARELREMQVQISIADSVSAQTQIAAGFEEATGTPPQGRQYMNPPSGFPAPVTQPPPGPAPGGPGH